MTSADHLLHIFLLLRYYDHLCIIGGDDDDFYFNTFIFKPEIEHNPNLVNMSASTECWN